MIIFLFHNISKVNSTNAKICLRKFWKQVNSRENPSTKMRNWQNNTIICFIMDAKISH